MIQLTEQQHEELKANGGTVRVLDPTTKAEYVVIPAVDYARLQQLREQAEDDAEQAAWADAVAEARSEMANE
jgi:hypothetical protein